MGASCFIAYNADTSALTATLALTNTAATVTPKTILQIKPGASKIRLIGWAYGFAVPPPAPVTVELLETGTVFATVTTIGSGIRAYNDSTGPASLASAGTSATGFNASAEGTITATRLFDMNYDNGMFYKLQFPLGREPEVNAASALRIRATPSTAVAVPMWACAIWEE